MLQRLYHDHHQDIRMASDILEVFCTFKVINSYRLPRQSSFGHVRHFPKHMLDVIPSDSPHKKLHTETMDLAVPLDPPHVSNEQPLEANRPTKKNIATK